MPRYDTSLELRRVVVRKGVRMAEPKKVLKWVGLGCGAMVLMAAIGIGACVLLIKGATDEPAERSHLFLSLIHI